ncbi:hypothetical protein [Streptomyces mirabilis]|uniref:hypothetical protein n=1 Tax=Streptomyces mirabilis TaxID=68239 RepID=UPI0033A74DAC
MLDALLSAGSPHLKDVTLELLQDLVADHPASSARRRGFFKMSWVLAANGFIPEPLTGSHQQRGTRPETVASVPPEWLEMVLRWRKFSTNEPGTIRTKFPLLLVAGRWAAERHPKATSPQAWTRDIAAEYIADTVIAVRGQWAGHNRNRTGWGEPLSASGKARRIDTIRSFFCDLIEWEWITPRFDPRRVLALPLSVRAGRDPDPRIIDDAAWAKLMAAGLTLTSDDLRAYGTPRAKAAGWHANHYPIERARATIATQLLNAKDPLSLADLQQWLGHKHPSSTRYYAKILQRTLSAAYKKADYFARNVRTIQALIDRESILTGAAASGEQPWKYYDWGEGYCSYDFFAKCPHRLACARCPFYVPKTSSRGQLLAVKDGIDERLEQLNLTDEEREALEGDREAVAALAERLADTPTPAGPTPRDLGPTGAFVPLTRLMSTVPAQNPGQHDKRDIDRRPPGYQE